MQLNFCRQPMMETSMVILLCLVTTASAQTTDSTEIISACGDYSYSDPHGVISSPNYPGNYYDNLDCNYQVYTSTGNSLSFIFKSFHVEAPDTMTIRCGNSGFPQHDYSGHTLPNPVSIPMCNSAIINFRTDYTNVASGFSIEYYASDEGCGNTLFTGSTGFVNSPNWPEFYRYNENCSNVIWAPVQSRIRLFFHFFNLDSNCSSDWLEVSCLDNSVFGVQRFCGNYNLHDISITECSQVLLSFHSDDTNNYQGFNIEYTIYSTAASDCGNTAFFDPSGVITSPNYPGNYSNDLYCQYNVYTSLGSGLLFIYTSFSVEGPNDFVEGYCVTNSSYHIDNSSGTGESLPNPISYEECSQGAVRLHTDHNIVSSGFSVDYYVNVGGCGNTVYTSSSGYVTSPNWPSNYGYNQNCTNVIRTYDRSIYYLNIQTFVLQDCSCSCDWLEISCVDNPVYGPTRYCGSLPSFDMYIYKCTQVLLWFHSDESSNDQGFNIEYNVIFPDAGDSKVPGKRKSNAEEIKPYDGRQNAGGSIPRENAPSNGNWNAADSVAGKR